jgi:hypothetical protein
MGCICQGSICTISCGDGSTYDCGTDPFSCSPQPCCGDCDATIDNGRQVNQTSGSTNCRTSSGGVVGGTWTRTSYTQSYSCQPISPPPEGCATTTSPPPPPPNTCNNGGSDGGGEK